MNKRIVFIGHIGKGFGDILYLLNQKFKLLDIDFLACAFHIHEDAFQNYFKDFTILHFDFPNENTLFFYGDTWDILFRADIYILWNGYHGFYANLKNYFQEQHIPYILSEYTSLKSAYFFDIGLHAESTATSFLNIEYKNVNIELLSEYVIQKNNHVFKELNINFSQNIPKILFISMWDDASGITFPNNQKTIRKLSPYFNSSLEAAQKLISELSVDRTIILKAHPNDSDENKNKLKSLSDNNRILYNEDADIYELIEQSDVVVTIASTVSVIAAYFEKPLIILGNTYITNSNYPLKYTPTTNFNSLIDQALLQKNNLKNEKERFFTYYLTNCNIYSNDLLLNSLGVKNIESFLNIIDQILITNHSIRKTKYVDIFELVYNLNTTLHNKVSELNQTKTELNQTKNTINELENEVLKYAQSRSWKITRPLRTLIKLFQGK